LILGHVLQKKVRDKLRIGSFQDVLGKAFSPLGLDPLN
jgi:hypothetical protein